MQVQIKRVYEKPSSEDGTRILVDRLWPRGLTKEKAKVDVWLKEVSPSQELRMWFNHDPAKWEEFQQRYLQELNDHPAAVDDLRAYAKNGPVTLVFGAKDELHNNAVVLQTYLS